MVEFAPEVEPSDSPAVRITHLTALVAGRDGPTRGVDVQALVTLTESVGVLRLDEIVPSAVVRELEAIPSAHDPAPVGST